MFLDVYAPIKYDALLGCWILHGGVLETMLCARPAHTELGKLGREIHSYRRMGTCETFPYTLVVLCWPCGNKDAPGIVLGLDYCNGLRMREFTSDQLALMESVAMLSHDIEYVRQMKQLSRVVRELKEMCNDTAPRASMHVLTRW